MDPSFASVLRYSLREALFQHPLEIVGNVFSYRLRNDLFNIAPDDFSGLITQELCGGSVDTQ